MKINLANATSVFLGWAALAILPLPAPVHGAEAGFPFVEDFQPQPLLDSTQTTARWTGSSVTLGRARGTHRTVFALQDRLVGAVGTDAIHDIALQDLNGDGRLDMVTAGQNGVVVYFNHPVSGFSPASSTVVTTTFFHYLTFGDYDEDGDVDIVAGSWQGRVHVMLHKNDGRGGFDSGAAIRPSLPVLRVNDLATADIDGDGHLDLVLALNGPSGGIDLYRGDGAAGFEWVDEVSSVRPHWDVSVGDLNRDGRPDLVVGKKQSSSVFHLNLGGWRFDRAVSLGHVGNSTALGDVNNDGHLDIVMGVKWKRKRLYLNNGRGGFSTGVEIGNIRETADVALGDMDGDGDLDIVEGNIRGLNSLSFIYTNDGSGSFDEGGSNIQSALTRAVALGDVDNDGGLDIAFGHQNATLRVKTNTGGTGAASAPDGSMFDTGRGRVVSGKVNGDAPVPHIVYLTATAVQPVHTDIEYYLSNDGGERWVRAYPDESVRFPEAGSDLRWRTELKSRSSTLTPTLTRVGIENVLQVFIDGDAFRGNEIFTATSQTTQEASGPVPIRLVNRGDRALTITDIETIGQAFDVREESDRPLPETITQGAVYMPRLMFSPTRRATTFSVMTISSSEGERVLPEIKVRLQGQGLAPKIDIPDIFLDAIVARVGTSESGIVRIENNGEESLRIRTSTITNPAFSLVNPAAFPVPVPANDSVGIEFWFEPEGRGDIATTVTFVSNAINGTQTATLRGKGVAPLISVQQPGTEDSIERIEFDRVTATHISTLHHVIRNEGELPLIITSVTVQNSWFQVIEPLFGGAFGPFREVPTGSTLALVVQFEPQGRATTNDALFIHSDALNNDEVSPVPVDGTGIAAEMVIHVTEARVMVADTANQMIDSGDSYHFGDVAVNTTASARVFVSNQRGDALLRFTPRLDGPGSFRWQEPPGGPGMVEMKAGDMTSTLVLSFAPATHGPTSATLTLGDSNALEGDREVVLTGVGRGAEMELRVGGRLLAAGTTHTIGDTRVDASTEVRVEVHNLGNVPMSVGRPTGEDTGDMTGFVLDETGGLPRVVTEGHSVTFTFRFNPDKRGTAITEVTFGSNAAVSGTQTIILKNQAVGPLISFELGAVEFGKVRARSSTDRKVVVTNTGDAPLMVTSATVVANREGVSESVLSLLEPKRFPQVVSARETLELTVRFMPDRPDGVIEGDLTIISDAVNVDNPGREPRKLDISGEGVASEITVWINGMLASKPDVMSYDFGDIRVDASSRAEVIIDNRGGSASLEVQSPRLNSPALVSNPHFDMTEKVDFPLVVAKGVSRSSLTLLFDPQERGVQTTTLTFVSDAFNGDSQVITLRGRGVGPKLVVEVDDVVREFGREFRFGERRVNTMTSVRVRIENRGNTVLDITERVEVETAAADFQFLDRDPTPTGKLRPTVGERYTPPYLVGESAPTIAAGSSSTFMLHFTPSVPSRKDNGRLVINSNDPDSPEWALNLKGSGRGALMRVTLIANNAVHLHPAQTNVHDVGEVRVGQRLGGNDLFVRLQNLGNENLNVSLGMAEGSEGFSIDNQDKQHSLGENWVQRPPIIFEPTRPGNHTGTVVIESNDDFLREFRIQLTGKGLAPDIDVQAVNFGDVQVNGSSPAEVVVHNRGDARLRISNVVRGADTQFNHDISRSLPIFVEPDEVSTLSVSFSPTVQGVSSTTLTFISDSFSENSHAVTLKGRGIGKPRIEVAINDVVRRHGGIPHQFASQRVGTTASVEVRISNLGNVPLDITESVKVETAAADFQFLDRDLTPTRKLRPTVDERHTPPYLVGESAPTIAAGSSSTFMLHFAPSVPSRKDNGRLVIKSNDPDHPEWALKLKGSGRGALMRVTLITNDAAYLHPRQTHVHDVGDSRFNWQLRGDLYVRLQNLGNENLNVSLEMAEGSEGFSIGGQYSLWEKRVVGPWITFIPRRPGNHTGTVVIKSNDDFLREFRIQLRGRGLAPDIDVQAVDFGDVQVRGSSHAEVVVHNRGDARLRISNVVRGAGTQFNYDISRSLPILLEPDEVSTLSVSFSPTVQGVSSTTLTFISDSYGENSHAVTLKGKGVKPRLKVSFSGCAAGSSDVTGAVSHGTVRCLFGDVLVGEAKTVTATLTNTGDGQLNINNIYLSWNTSPLFALDEPSSKTISPGDSHSWGVKFAPTTGTAGTRSGWLYILGNYDNPLPQFDFDARAVKPVMVVDVHRLTRSSGGEFHFGEREVNTTQSVLVTIRNRGNGTLKITEPIRVETTATDFLFVERPQGQVDRLRPPLSERHKSPYSVEVDASVRTISPLWLGWWAWSHTFTVHFNPSVPSRKDNGRLVINSNDPNNPRWVLNLKGNGKGGLLRVTWHLDGVAHDTPPGTGYDAGSRPVNQNFRTGLRVRLHNLGNDQLDARAEMSGDSEGFTIVRGANFRASNIGPSQSGAGDAHYDRLYFWPRRSGAHTGTVVIKSDDDTFPELSMQVTGNGLSAQSWAGGAQRPAIPTFTALEPVDIIAPLFDGLGYADGQSRLWLAFDEPVQVLSGTGARALADGAVLSGFEVLPNYTGGDGVEDIGVLRAGYRSGGVVMELARGIVSADASVWVRYTPPSDGVSGIYDMAVLPNRISSVRLFMLPRSAVLDYDGDGFPDALEARLGGNPLVADDVAGLPEIALLRAGAVGSPAAVAYSGIRADGVAAHLGVVTTGTSSLAAYYLSDTFGYSGGYAENVGGYGCTGRFPADYASPLFGGGCAVVDFNNIRAGVEHRIGWLATNAAGYWAVAEGTVSRLPEQVILRVPEFNMKQGNVFVGNSAAADAEVLVGALHDGPASSQSLTVSLSNVAAADSPSSMEPDGFSVSVAGVTTDTASYAITGVHSGEDSKLWLAGDPLSSLTPDKYSLGKVTQTEVVRLGDDNLPPLFGRASLYAGTTADENKRHAVVVRGTENYIALLPVVHGTAQTASAFEVSPWGGAGGGEPVAANDRILAVSKASPAADGALVRIAFTASNPPATVRNTVSLEVAASSAGASTATTVLTWPVIDSADELASIAGDNDNDSIPDVRDSYPLLNRLPISVAGGVSGYPDRSSAGADGWHHIRPLLPLHNQFVGSYATRAGLSFHTGFNGDARILARLPVATSGGETIAAPEGQSVLAATYQPGVPIQMNYADFAASLSRDEFDAMVEQSRRDIAVVYNFRLHGVEPSVAQATQGASLAGGRAGVVIPLPESLHDHTNILPLHYTNGAWSGFSTESDTPATAGFAPLQAGACPDDNGLANSPYRTTGGALNTRKRTGDACMVLYLTDGAAADRDGNINGVVDALIGLAATAPPR